MISALMPEGRQRYFNNDGTPAAGGKLYTYAAGTTNPKATYQDVDGTTPHPNPIVLDAKGEAVIFWSGAYKVDLKQADAQQVTGYPVDNYNTDPGGLQGATATSKIKGSWFGNVVAWVSDLGTQIGASLIGYYQGSVGAVVRSIQARLRDTISVKDFGAVGDGVTDDSVALNLAAAALGNGKSLYFPAGTYIVNSACVVFRGKTGICVYGDGAATIVRPSVQGIAPVKQDYITTMAFDLCSNVTVRDMVIESKGESYGNIDAYTPASGQDRADAIINFGGSALLVSRSDHVMLLNLIARRCGSCGVVYLSSCEEVVVVNCFANARSLGYAGFAVDNWVHSTLKTKRTYKFINCRVSKEDSDYAAKAGIASEGDEVTGRLINLDVVGGCFEDCYTGANVLWQGAGISCMETRLTMNGVNTKNCYIGLTWIKRGGAVDKSWCRVTGGAFDSCAVTGAYIAISTATGGADVSLIGTRIDVQAASVWAAQTDNSVKYSSGITVPGFSSGEINVDGCRISGGQYGIWAIDTASFNVIGSEIFGSIAAIRTYGGGNLKVVGGRLVVTAGDRVIGRDTANLAATASSTLDTQVIGALLETVGNTAADYLIILAGNGALFTRTLIKGNAAPRGVYNASRGSATLYDVDILDSAGTWTPVVAGSVTPGTYEINAGATRATYVRRGSLVTLQGYISMAGAVTGGGTGDLSITGLPFPKRVDTSAFGQGAFSGVDIGTGALINAYFGTLQASSNLFFWQTTDNAGVTLVPISGVSAGDLIAFSITYEA